MGTAKGNSKPRSNLATSIGVRLGDAQLGAIDRIVEQLRRTNPGTKRSDAVRILVAEALAARAAAQNASVRG